MYRWITLLVCVSLVPSWAATSPPAAPTTAPSRIVAVTVYQTSALVTREVTVPAGPGATEVVVSPLPASTVNSSLYSEGGDGLRILTTRYRTRATAETTQEEMRKLETQVKALQRDDQLVAAADPGDRGQPCNC